MVLDQLFKNFGSILILSICLGACSGEVGEILAADTAPDAEDTDPDTDDGGAAVGGAPTLVLTSPDVDLTADMVTVTVGQVINFELAASDPDGDELTFSAAQTAGPATGVDGAVFTLDDDLFLTVPDAADDDIITIDISASDGTNTTTESFSLTVFVCPLVGNITPAEVVPDGCTLTGVMTSSATISNEVTWLLDDRFQIGNNASQASLTIDAGTQILGSDADHILVWPGSSISSNGTADAPVQMLSEDADTSGSGEWGGLFIRGFNGLPTLTGTQGANNLDFTVVAEAGAPVSVTIDGETANYQDNIVLNGVDSTTTLAFVQSHYSARDGFRILNGDPRMAWLLATASTSDGVWYNNFNGLIKDLLVIHNTDSGRAGIYAGEDEAADANSNPRIVNATLVGRDDTSENGNPDPTAREFGLLFADNTDEIRIANVVVANFTNGCYETADGADLSAIDTDLPGPVYLDGIHCLNEAGGNLNFAVIRPGTVDLPLATRSANNLNEDGHVYYNGFVNPANFSGETTDLTNAFTASWYLESIGNLSIINNGVLDTDSPNPNLNAFLDGDTNNDGVVDTADQGAGFIIADNAFNADVQANTGGYDLTIIGAIRGGNPIVNNQFDGWTVGTGPDEGFVVQVSTD